MPSRSFHFCVLSAISLFATASAVPAVGATTTIFASGVSENTGWYNYKKGSTRHCWAANAANLVCWWQDRLAEKYVLPSGVPVREQVWETYRTSFYDTGGVASSAVGWWLTGDYQDYSSVKDGSTGGYYPTLDVPDSLSFDSLLFQFFPGETTLEEFSLRIAEKLRSGAGLIFNIAAYGKAVTVWGVELDEETSLLTKIFLTNPSWESSELLTVECYAVDVAGFDTPVRSYYLSGFTEGNYISAVSGLSSDIGDALPLIPEPSAAALIFGAGAAATAFSARRRSRRMRGG